MRSIVRDSIKTVIGTAPYTDSRVSYWTNAIIEACLVQLTKLQKPFKYIVTCIIYQKNGAGLQVSSSCYWDPTLDGSTTYKIENKTMYIIVSVFGLAI